MKQVYDEFYKIFGCNTSCGGKKCPDPCDISPDNFCFEPADCNDCIIERIGLAEAYVPYQTDISLMEPEKSLELGTAFEELVIPYTRTLKQSGGRKFNG